MWINELTNLYQEAWGPTTPNLPGNARGVIPAVETQDSLRHKGVFAAGGSPASLVNQSMASGQSPMEQEEDQSALLDFDKWWKEEGGLFNFDSPEIQEASKKLAFEAWISAKDFYK